MVLVQLLHFLVSCCWIPPHGISVSHQQTYPMHSLNIHVVPYYECYCLAVGISNLNYRQLRYEETYQPTYILYMMTSEFQMTQFCPAKKPGRYFLSNMKSTN